MKSAPLYYYSDFQGNHGWFASPSEFRKAFPGTTVQPMRCAHVGIKPPEGYTKSGELAFDAVNLSRSPRPLQGHSTSAPSAAKDSKRGAAVHLLRVFVTQWEDAIEQDHDINGGDAVEFLQGFYQDCLKVLEGGR